MTERLERLTGEEELSSWIVQGTEEGPRTRMCSQSPEAAAESRMSRLGILGGQAKEQWPATAARKFQISYQEQLSRCTTGGALPRGFLWRP